MASEGIKAKEEPAVGTVGTTRSVIPFEGVGFDPEEAQWVNYLVAQLHKEKGNTEVLRCANADL